MNTALRIAFRPEGGPAHIVSDDHPAYQLFDDWEPTEDRPAPVSDAYRYLTGAFGLDTVLATPRGHLRTLAGGESAIMEYLRLTSQTGAELIIYGPPHLDDPEDRALIGTISMLAVGAFDDDANEDTKFDAVSPLDDARHAGEAAFGELVTLLTDSATDDPQRLFIDELKANQPAELVIGNCSLRVYDEPSHRILRSLFKLTTALRQAVVSMAASMTRAENG